MSWTAVATELRAKDFLARLRAAEDRISKKRYKRLLATTVAQVLSLHPDFDLRKALRRAERAAGAAPVKRLLKSKKRVVAALVKGSGVRRRRAAAARPRPHEDEPPPSLGSTP